MTQSIGPPSLAQGTRIAVGFSTSISRFIPACGELSKPSWAIVQLDGSSPLARGTQDLDRLGYVADRFIPAYAGNSWRLRYSCGLVPVHPCWRGTPVHPRLRGELDLACFLCALIAGSSPLTRGTRQARHWLRYPSRFIPAYAGNSRETVSRSKSKSVHPRLRGELRLQLPGGRLHNGSSPLTRGTQLAIRQRERGRRFIPAYAGNSFHSIQQHTSSPVHPRLRGELRNCRIDNGLPFGSSPLTRGTRSLILP